MQCDILCSAYDRPTGHSLLTLTHRDLPDLRTVHLSRCGNFETAHGPMKSEDPKMWRTMLQRQTERRSLRLIQQGRVWEGPDCKRVSAGGAVLQKYRGRTRGFKVVAEHPPYLENRQWCPMKYTTQAKVAKPPGFNLNAALRSESLCNSSMPEYVVICIWLCLQTSWKRSGSRLKMLARGCRRVRKWNFGLSLRFAERWSGGRCASGWVRLPALGGRDLHWSPITSRTASLSRWWRRDGTARQMHVFGWSP